MYNRRIGAGAGAGALIEPRVGSDKTSTCHPAPFRFPLVSQAANIHQPHTRYVPLACLRGSEVGSETQRCRRAEPISAGVGKLLPRATGC